MSVGTSVDIFVMVREAVNSRGNCRCLCYGRYFMLIWGTDARTIDVRKKDVVPVLSAKVKHEKCICAQRKLQNLPCIPAHLISLYILTIANARTLKTYFAILLKVVMVVSNP